MRESKFDVRQGFRPLSVRAMIEPFRRRWWILLTSAAGAALLAWFLTASLPATYTATASIIIDRDRVPLGNIAELVSSADMTDSVIVSNEIAVILSEPVLSGAVARAHGATARSLGVDELEALKSSISVTRNLNSLVIDVTAKTSSPASAAALANAIVDEYLTNKVNARRAAADRTLGWIDGEVTRLREGITDLNRQVQEKQRAFLSEGDGTPLIVQSQLRAVGDAYATASIERDNTAAKLDEVRSARDQGVTEASRLIDSPDLIELQRQIGVLQQEIAGAAVWRNDGPGIAEQRARIAQLEGRASELVEREIARMELDLRVKSDQVAKLSAERQRLQAETISLSETQAEIEQIGHEIAGNQQLYVELLTRRNEIAAQQEGISPEARMLNTALAPSTPSGPRRKLYAVLAGFLGFVGAFGGILLWDSVSTRYRSLGHLAESTGMPLLAATRRRVSRKPRPVRDFELGTLPGPLSLMLQLEAAKRAPAAAPLDLIALMPATRGRDAEALAQGLELALRGSASPVQVVFVTTGEPARATRTESIPAGELLRHGPEELRAKLVPGGTGRVFLVLPSPEEAEIAVGWAALADRAVLVVGGRQPDKRACEQALGRLRRAKAAVAGFVAVV